MFNSSELKALKRKLPTNWVDRIKTKVDFGSTKIRATLKSPDKYDKVIIDAAIEVAEEYKKEMEVSILLQKQKIKDLGTL